MARKLPYPVFDADNHFYEPKEALTKFLPDHRKNVIDYIEVRGRTKIMVRNQVSDYIPNPTFEVVARPGAQEEYFRHGSGGKSKSKGGGCSSSKKSNDDYDDYDDHGGSGSYDGSSTGTVSPAPSSATSQVDVEVVDCVKPAQKKRKGKPARKADTTATLRISSHDALSGTYTITLEFKGASGSAVDSAAAHPLVAPRA